MIFPSSLIGSSYHKCTTLYNSASNLLEELLADAREHAVHVDEVVSGVSREVLFDLCDLAFVLATGDVRTLTEADLHGSHTAHLIAFSSGLRTCSPRS